MKGPSYLCGKCLIGWTVPAIRPDRKRWEFGKVENYNELTSEHSVRFRNEKVYSVIVDEKPFEEYVRSYTMVKSSSQSLVAQEPKGGNSSEEESSLELENCTMVSLDNVGINSNIRFLPPHDFMALYILDGLRLG